MEELMISKGEKSQKSESFFTMKRPNDLAGGWLTGGWLVAGCLMQWLTNKSDKEIKEELNYRKY